jgi:hypothetical protein
MLDGFDILVNGVPLQAGQNLKSRERGDEIAVVNRATKEWVLIVDPLAIPTTWKPDPYLSGQTSPR